MSAVSQAEEEEIPTFVMLRRLLLVAWVGSHAETGSRPVAGSFLHRSDGCSLLCLPQAFRVSSVETNHDLGKSAGIIAPGLDHGRRLFQRDDGAHGFVYRKAMLFEHANHFTKVFRQGIA